MVQCVDDVCYWSDGEELATRTEARSRCEEVFRKINHTASLAVINSRKQAEAFHALLNNYYDDDAVSWIDLYSTTDVSTTSWVWIDGSPLQIGSLYCFFSISHQCWKSLRLDII